MLKEFLFLAPSVNKINAILSVKGGTQLQACAERRRFLSFFRDLFLRLFPAIEILVSPVAVSQVFLLLTFLFSILHTQGKEGLVKHLKTSGVLLQQALGGHVIENVTLLGPRVSRNSSGYPRCIPALHRARIMTGDTKLIKLYLSIFALYRVINVKGKAKLQTITGPFTGNNISVIDLYLPLFHKLFVAPRFKAVSFSAKIKSYSRVFPIWKSSVGTGSFGSLNDFASHPFTVIFSGLALMGNTVLRSHLQRWISYTENHSLQRIFTMIVSLHNGLLAVGGGKMVAFRIIFENIQRFVWKAWLPGPIKDKIFIFNQIFDMSTYLKESRLDEFVKFSSLWENFRLPRALGKLAFLPEAAGKVRVIAMVDPLTQWVFYPLHSIILYILEGYRMDGTFDQVAPLAYLKESKELYSLDLSAATDRLPVKLQTKLMSLLVGDDQLATAWEELLVQRTYRYTNKKGAYEVSYAVGQPMGVLSSWAMLALTHHFIVQCAYWRQGGSPNHLYQNYALLGDDLVLGDYPVMVQYLHILKELGVECGLHKSVVSHQGTSLEFAKRTYFKGVDVSPVPLTEFIAACSSVSSMVAYATKYSLTLVQIARTMGYGYRVKSRIHGPIALLPAALRATFVAALIPTTPAMVEAWFNVGAPKKVGSDFISNNKDILNAFVQYELGALVKDLQNLFYKFQIPNPLNLGHFLSIGEIEGASTELSSLPDGLFKRTCDIIATETLTALTEETLKGARETLASINFFYWFKAKKGLVDLKQMYIFYLEALDKWARLSPDKISLTMNVRVQPLRGAVPSQVKIWRR